MKKLSKLIPEYEKLVPILFLLLLNLIAYANYNIYETDNNFNVVNFFVLLISFLYAYISISPKLEFGDCIKFMLLISFVTIIINDNYKFNIIGTILMIMFFNNRQNILISFIRIFIAILIQFLINYIYFNYIGNDYFMFSFLYFPFSFITYYVGGVINVGWNKMVFRKGNKL